MPPSKICVQDKVNVALHVAYLHLIRDAKAYDNVQCLTCASEELFGKMDNAERDVRRACRTRRTKLLQTRALDDTLYLEQSILSHQKLRIPEN